MLGLLNHISKMPKEHKLGILNLILSEPGVLEGLAPRMTPQNTDVQVTPGADNSFYTGEAPTTPNPVELQMQSMMPSGNFASKAIPRVPRGMFEGWPNAPVMV